MPRTAAQREVARLRKRREADTKRERQQIALAEFERLLAIRKEQTAEEQAPAQQRAVVMGVTATLLKAGSSAPVVLRDALVDHDPKRGGYRRADPLMRMHKANSALVTRLHLAAARKFSEDYEVGNEGAAMSGGVKEFVDGGSGGDVPEARLDAMARYRAACDAMGPSLRTGVQFAVLHKYSIARIAVLVGMSEERASGWLLGGLDRLADHYWPDRPSQVDAVDRMLMVDAAVRDVPQERLGRRPAA